MTEIRTDADVMRIANEIDNLSWQIQDLIASVGDSLHPNADKLKEALEEQCCFFAWANHVAHPHLEHPNQWDCDKSPDGGWLRFYHKAGRQAARTRFANKMEKRKRDFERQASQQAADRAQQPETGKGGE